MKALAVLSYMLGLFLLSSLSAVDGLSCAKLSAGVGNLVHIPLYAVLGGLLYRAFSKQQILLRLGYVWTIGALFAVSDEIHQTFVPGRTFSMTDIDLDLLGLVIGIVVVILFQRGRALLAQYSTRGSQ
jgi:VanZ family protein